MFSKQKLDIGTEKLILQILLEEFEYHVLMIRNFNLNDLFLVSFKEKNELPFSKILIIYNDNLICHRNFKFYYEQNTIYNQLMFLYVNKHPSKHISEDKLMRTICNYFKKEFLTVKNLSSLVQEINHCKYLLKSYETMKVLL